MFSIYAAQDTLYTLSHEIFKHPVNGILIETESKWE